MIKTPLRSAIGSPQNIKKLKIEGEKNGTVREKSGIFQNEKR
jgi:hypothetical protein